MSKKIYLLSSILLIIFTLGSCEIKEDPIKIIKISTEYGDFNVWTKKVGNNPTKKVLLLHGGPGANHQYFKENFKGYEGYADDIISVNQKYLTSVKID